MHVTVSWGAGSYSPHARGCAEGHDLKRTKPSFVPACAGVFPGDERSDRKCLSLPRMRGGAPSGTAMCVALLPRDAGVFLQYIHMNAPIPCCAGRSYPRASPECSLQVEISRELPGLFSALGGCVTTVTVEYFCINWLPVNADAVIPTLVVQLLSGVCSGFWNPVDHCNQCRFSLSSRLVEVTDWGPGASRRICLSSVWLLVQPGSGRQRCRLRRE